MNKSNVVARMTVTREVGNITIIEVSEDATFHKFYSVFTQIGKRRSTKRLVRTASRNEGLPYYAAHRCQPGLDVLAEHWQKQPGVATVKIRIIKRRLYRRLINAQADELGMSKVGTVFPAEPVWAKAQISFFPSFKLVEKLNHSKLHAGSTR